MNEASFKIFDKGILFFSLFKESSQSSFLDFTKFDILKTSSHYFFYNIFLGIHKSIKFLSLLFFYQKFLYSCLDLIIIRHFLILLIFFS